MNTFALLCLVSISRQTAIAIDVSTQGKLTSRTSIELVPNGKTAAAVALAMYRSKLGTGYTNLFSKIDVYRKEGYWMARLNGLTESEEFLFIEPMEMAFSPWLGEVVHFSMSQGRDTPARFRKIHQIRTRIGVEPKTFRRLTSEIEQFDAPAVTGRNPLGIPTQRRPRFVGDSRTAIDIATAILLAVQNPQLPTIYLPLKARKYKDSWIVTSAIESPIDESRGYMVIGGVLGGVEWFGSCVPSQLPHILGMIDKRLRAIPEVKDWPR